MDTPKILLINILFTCLRFDRQTVDNQMKLDLVIVQINTIKVDLKKIINAHMARKYGSQNVPQEWG